MSFYYRISLIHKNIGDILKAYTAPLDDFGKAVLYDYIIYSFGSNDMLYEMVNNDLIRQNKLNISDDDNDYYILTKIMLLDIINYYRKKTYDNYLLLSSFKNYQKRFPDGTKEEYKKIRQQYFNKKIYYWENNNNVFALDSNNKFNFISAWSYEYEVFELINIYNSVDIKDYDLIIWGA